MKAFLDFLPVVAFFVAYIAFGRDIFLATKVLMAATAIQMLLLVVFKQEISNMHKTSAVLVLVLGGVTVFMRNDLFIKWKPTALYWLFAAVLLATEYLQKKSVVEHLLGHAVTLEKNVWRTVSHLWAVSFFLFGVINLWVVYSFSEATWVNFKLFGLMSLTFLLMIATGLLIARHAPDEEEKT